MLIERRVASLAEEMNDIGTAPVALGASKIKSKNLIRKMSVVLYVDKINRYNNENKHSHFTLMITPIYPNTPTSTNPNN